jgi:hypothetical protein
MCTLVPKLVGQLPKTAEVLAAKVERARFSEDAWQ